MINADIIATLSIYLGKNAYLEVYQLSGMGECLQPFRVDSVDYCLIRYNKSGHPVEPIDNMKPAIIYNRRIYHPNGGYYYYNNFFRIGNNPKWNITRWNLNDNTLQKHVMNQKPEDKYKFLHNYYWTKYLIFKYSRDGITLSYNHCNLRYSDNESGLSYYSRSSAPYYIRGLQITENFTYGKYERGDISFQFRDKQVVAILIKNRGVSITRYMPLIDKSHPGLPDYPCLKRKIVYFRNTNIVHRDISYFRYRGETIYHGPYRIYRKDGKPNDRATICGEYFMGSKIDGL